MEVAQLGEHRAPVGVPAAVLHLHGLREDLHRGVACGHRCAAFCHAMPGGSCHCVAARYVDEEAAVLGPLRSLEVCVLVRVWMALKMECEG
jgi:hypothetical protein